MEFTEEKMNELKEEINTRLDTLFYVPGALTEFDFNTPEEGDRFFRLFGPGNAIGIVDRPLERFSYYENLLKKMEECNPDKYKEIHKGTAFYFLAWLGFQLHSFGKAVFYMDAALTEDIRKTMLSHRRSNPSEQSKDEELSKALINTWIENPSGLFLQLESQNTPSPISETVEDITNKLRTQWEYQLNRFRTETGNEISIERFIKDFILEIAISAQGRSIVTGLYSFMLEYDEIKTLIQLRSTGGGSIEPILTYLFKGALIFESLLKIKNKINTLEDINEKPLRQKYNINSRIKTSSKSIESIIKNINGNEVQNAFTTTTKIRNTTGHNLAWPDVFNCVCNFDKLFNQIINAFLFICNTDFL